MVHFVEFKSLQTNFLFLLRFRPCAMEIISLLSYLVLFTPVVFLLCAVIQSFIEKENRAALLLLGLMSGWLLVVVLIMIIPVQAARELVVLILACSILLLALIVLFPWKEKKWSWPRGLPDRIDERNIMFSRAELIEGSERYNSYYREFPEHKRPDDEFRRLAGLLSEKSKFYNPWLFGAADAAFFTVESLHPKTDGPVNQVKKESDALALSRFIKQWGRWGDRAMKVYQATDSLNRMWAYNIGQTIAKDLTYAEAKAQADKLFMSQSYRL